MVKGQPTKIEATKYDQKKVRMDLLPPDVLFGWANILTFGATKYDDRNWEKGMEWGRVYGALQRHLNIWWAGEELDAETGESHLDHAMCCLSFLSAYQKRKIGTDDRYITSEKEIPSYSRRPPLDLQNVDEEGNGA